MTLFDAFKVGGVPGVAASIGAKASPTISDATAKAVFSGTAKSSGFSLGLTDKLMITLVLGTVFVVATSRAVK